MLSKTTNKTLDLVTEAPSGMSNAKPLLFLALRDW
jgi:hypothetical protein